MKRLNIVSNFPSKVAVMPSSFARALGFSGALEGSDELTYESFFVAIHRSKTAQHWRGVRPLCSCSIADIVSSDTEDNLSFAFSAMGIASRAIFYILCIPTVSRVITPILPALCYLSHFLGSRLQDFVPSILCVWALLYTHMTDIVRIWIRSYFVKRFKLYSLFSEVFYFINVLVVVPWA